MTASITDGVVRLLGHTLLDATALALITGALAITVLRRARPALLGGLWTVVLLKFAIPVAPSLPVSLSGLIDRVLSGVDAPHAPAVSHAAPVEVAPAVAPAGGEWGLVRALLVGAWVAIALALFLRAILQHRAAGRLARSLPAAGGEIEAVVARGAERMRLRRAPEARISDAGASPYLVGLVHPILVIPRWLSAAPAALEAAVLHELAHIRRKDLWARWFEVAVKSALFFWPVVHWVCRRIDDAREMACDEWACDRQFIDRVAYARFLVAVAKRSHIEAPLPATALFRRRSRLESRIDSLIGRRSTPRLNVALATALSAWAIVGLAAAPSDAARGADSGLLCVIEPGVRDQILAHYPEADQDGDGLLSKREVCAHQLRMKRKLLDGVVDAELVSRIDPDADLDGDGTLGEWEIEWFKNQIDVAVDTDSSVVLQVRDVGRVELPREDLRVDTASVPAPVCESEKCLEDRGAGGAHVLIGVAFERR